MYCEAILCADTHTVRFAIYPDGLDGPRITAHISEAALRAFGHALPEEDLTVACEAHFDCIEAKALERYRSSPSSPILLDLEDVSVCALPH
ncbi:hypothetical protein [Variovorax sp. KK3]|uniref:hypothetical protein n=1 Tax=Variovorax sp. KK3 TaxID=1855728 RepID=UPI00097C68E2|nr:hypothetical protein [Variovorax sp. KK3]